MKLLIQIFSTMYIKTKTYYKNHHLFRYYPFPKWGTRFPEWGTLFPEWMGFLKGGLAFLYSKIVLRGKDTFGVSWKDKLRDVVICLNARAKKMANSRLKFNILKSWLVSEYERIRQWPVTDISVWPLANKLSQNKKPDSL